MALHDCRSHQRSPGTRAWLRSSCLLLLAGVTVAVILFHSGRSTTPGSISNLVSPLQRRLAVHKRDTLPSGIRKPPQAPQLFNDNPETVMEKTRTYITAHRRLVDGIIKNIDLAKATFNNVIVPFVEQSDRAGNLLAAVGIYPGLSNDTALVEAVQAVQPNLTAIGQEIYLNEDLFKRVDAVFQKQRNDETLSAESRKLLEGIHGDFIGSGIKLPAGQKRQKYRDDDRKLSELRTNFSKAITDDNTALWFTPEELNGTKPRILKELEKGKGEHEGKLKVVVQSPQAGDILTYCTNGTTRQRLETAGNKVAPSNVKTLKEAVVIRNDQAHLLDYPSYAAWEIRNNMAKTPKAVNKFLNRVQTKVTPTADKQAEHLKSYKKNATGSDYFFTWDVGYYQLISTEREFKTDPEFFKEFFPAVQTLRKVLGFYSELFSLKFVRIEGKDSDALSSTGDGNDLVWHPDVELYGVWEGKGDGFLGYLYLDIFYRANKTPSAFTMPMLQGFETKDGKRHYPSAGLVTNSKKATDDADLPSLLYRGEVEDLLHEMGHCMHHLTSKTQYSRFHGPLGCPPDFFELPSQMMQNWAYIPAVLKRFSQHYTYLKKEYADAWKKANKGKEQPPKVLPDALTDSITRARSAYDALYTLGQWGLATYDQRLHNPSYGPINAINVTKLWNTITRNATRTDSPTVIGVDPGHGETTFTHLLGLYGAAYYSYLWSQVYAQDVFHAAFEKDPFSAETGYRWRKTVLEPGGTKDFFEILKDFLGREPNDEAFYRDLGVET